MSFDLATTPEMLLEKVVSPDFYRQETLELARRLLGKTVVSRVASNLNEAEPEITAGIIVETEGYIGAIDPACHAYTGLTKRNAVMWGEPGYAYVYFTYGNHWMLNIVTEEAGSAAAVLIRALQPIYGLAAMYKRRGVDKLKNLTNGPGKLCQALGLNGSHNGQALNGPAIYICDTPESLQLAPFEIVETTRIGISRGVDLPWRYYVKSNNFVSKF